MCVSICLSTNHILKIAESPPPLIFPDFDDESLQKHVAAQGLIPVVKIYAYPITFY